MAHLGRLQSRQRRARGRGAERRSEAVRRVTRLAKPVRIEGERQPADSIDVAPSLSYDTSITADPLLRTRGGVPSVTRIDIRRSTALIRVPDSPRYATSWRRWRVALRLGDAGEGARELTLAAPAPPP